MSDKSSPKSTKRVRIFVGIVVLLICVTVSMPFWVGRLYWHNVRTELEAKGEKLFPGDFKRTAIPDSENYFALPFFNAITTQKDLDKVIKDARELRGFSRSHELFNSSKVGKPVALSDHSRGLPLGATEEEKRVEALEWMEKELGPWEPLRVQFFTASDRPDSPSVADPQHHRAAFNVIALCRIHSIAALQKKDTAAALEDIFILQSMTRASSQQPGITYMFRAAQSWDFANRIAREGMQMWSDDELMRLNTILGRPPYDLNRFAEALRGDRAEMNDFFEKTMESGKLTTPNGVPLPRNMRVTARIALANYNLAIQTLIECLENPGSSPRDFEATQLNLRAAAEWKRPLLLWLHFLEVYEFQGLVVVQWFFATSDWARMTRVAIALERYHRKHGTLPAKLDDLAPTYLDQIPKGSIPGQEIHYQPGPKGGYKLWTNGWNETDEGGAPGGSRESLDWGLEKDP